MNSKFDASTYVDSIAKLFRKNGTATRAAGAKAYMRNQFEYYGLDTTTRRTLQKKFLSENLLPPKSSLVEIVESCWENENREMQYFAMELFEKYKKQFTAKDLPVFEFMITNKSWWDTVDFVAPKLIASLFLQQPQLIYRNTTKWMKSKNIWLMRSSIIFQLQYKKRTDEALLAKLILHNSSNPDFFIRKAIGWSLRQYGRTNPLFVKSFVKKHKDALSTLSYKEALKNL